MTAVVCVPCNGDAMKKKRMVVRIQSLSDWDTHLIPRNYSILEVLSGVSIPASA